MADDTQTSPHEPPDVPNSTARQYVALMSAGVFLAAFLIVGAGFLDSMDRVEAAKLLLGSFAGAAYFTISYLDRRT